MPKASRLSPSSRSSPFLARSERKRIETYPTWSLHVSPYATAGYYVGTHTDGTILLPAVFSVLQVLIISTAALVGKSRLDRVLYEYVHTLVEALTSRESTLVAAMTMFSRKENMVLYLH